MAQQRSHPANPPVPSGAGIQAQLELQVLQVLPRPAQLVPEAVARHYHETLVELFQGAQSEYNDVWRLVRVSFPYLCFHVLGPAGEALLGLLVDARNYPHRALSITLTDPSFNATATGVPGKPADTGRKGLVFNKEQQRHWFCTPGTDEYHTHYSGVEPFDRVRGDEKLDPLEVLLRCIRHIDLKELKAQLQQQAKGVGQTDRS